MLQYPTRMYSRHFEELAEAKGVKVDFITRTLSAMMFVEESPPRIEIHPVVDAQTYIVALHELGHVYNGHTQPREGHREANYYLTHGVVLCEAEAWSWAMEQARAVPPGTFEWGYNNGLGSYVAAARYAGLIPSAHMSYRGYSDKFVYTPPGAFVLDVAERMKAK